MTVAHERQNYARELRMSGMSYPDIAETSDPTADPRKPRRLYANASAARMAVLAAQARASGNVEPHDVPADERRALVYDRLELLIREYLPRAMAGNVDALREVRLLSQTQAQLYGLNLRPGASPTGTSAGEGDNVDDLSSKRAERVARDSAAADPASSG
jgi:hypothetical protein